MVYIRKSIFIDITKIKCIYEANILCFCRLIWNVKSSENATIYIVPNGKDDGDDDVLTFPLHEIGSAVDNWFLGDNFPEKVKDVGDYKIKLKTDSGTVLVEEATPTLKVGGNYQFVIQYDENEDSSYSSLMGVR